MEESPRQFAERMVGEGSHGQIADEAVRAQLIEDLTERLTRLIDRAILGAMAEYELATLERAIDEGRPQRQIQTIINSCVPPHKQSKIAERVKADFRAQYLKQDGRHG